jgi:hypothetical protein
VGDPYEPTDKDEAKLYRMAGWACRQEHLAKRVESVLVGICNEIAKYYGSKSPALPAAKLAAGNLIDHAFRQLAAKAAEAGRGQGED